MNISAKQTRGESGQALITAIIFLLALTFMGFGLVAMSTMDVSASRNLRLAEEALSAAEEGAFFGMAFAGNNDTYFVTNSNEGNTIGLKSSTNAGKTEVDRAQFQVLLTMGGRTEQPPGEIKAYSKYGGQMSSFMFVTVRVDSLGMVSEGQRSTFKDIALFDWAKRPMIKRSLEVVFRVRKAAF
ncbi:MAG TPA: PilX N-terminal domain-containing pilus assembly protein [bacterium]|nr:PilX N-terminal domain-containing pilus assembly protein [bacterium]